MSAIVDANTSSADALINKIDNSIDFAFQKVVTLPGDDITSNVTGLTTSIKLGHGLAQVNEKVVANSVGVLNYRAPNSYWSENSGKRYFPKVDDQVVGIVEEKGGEFYTINIYSGATCIMSKLAFDGATKRNKPELKRGDVIYARIIAANPDADVELTCMVASGPKKEWSTGETVIYFLLI
jgi:exosome complex component RRP40